jgi:heme/copper-type cytochrome/quinol oxidase subunit 2
MRLLALPVTLIVIAVLVYLLVTLARGGKPAARREAAGSPRWETDTVMENGWTLIVVRKVAVGPNGPVELTRQTVRAIRDDDPDWDERYREGMLEARNRVSTLEIESG